MRVISVPMLIVFHSIGKNNGTTHPPDRIFNMDETGLCIVQSECPSVHTLKGKSQLD